MKQLICNQHLLDFILTICLRNTKVRAFHRLRAVLNFSVIRNLSDAVLYIIAANLFVLTIA